MDERGSKEFKTWLYDLAFNKLTEKQVLQGFIKYYVVKEYNKSDVVDDIALHTNYGTDEILDFVEHKITNVLEKVSKNEELV